MKLSQEAFVKPARIVFPSIRCGLENATETMNRILPKAATSLWLIFFLALGARLGFAWQQERKFPRDVLAPAMFSQETGSIAKSLALGDRKSVV